MHELALTHLLDGINFLDGYLIICNLFLKAYTIRLSNFIFRHYPKEITGEVTKMYCSTVYNKEEFETTFYLQKVVKLYDTCTVEYYATVMGFPGGSVVKTLPAMQETWV